MVLLLHFFTPSVKNSSHHSGGLRLFTYYPPFPQFFALCCRGFFARGEPVFWSTRSYRMWSFRIHFLVAVARAAKGLKPKCRKHTDLDRHQLQQYGYLRQGKNWVEVLISSLYKLPHHEKNLSANLKFSMHLEIPGHS